MPALKAAKNYYIRNPYIIGRPIDEPEKFFGRESLFRFIEDNLFQDVKVILLYGQRRIGKSSVLEQIPNFVAPHEFVFVSFDLQDKNQSSLSDILHNLAIEIVEQLNLEICEVTLPTVNDLKAEPNIFSLNFLTKVSQLLGHKNLVLLLDEFDILVNHNSEIVNSSFSFFYYLERLLKEHKKLFIIPVLGRYLSDLPKLLTLFKGAPFQEIGFLDVLSARRLITKPSEGVLIYEPEAIQEILKLSAGHPYFTQVICFTLFNQARVEDKWMVTRANVEGIIDESIKNAEAGLAWFWDGLLIPEKVVFSVVAEAQNIAIAKDQRVPEEPFMLLKNYGVIITDTLTQAATQLIQTGFLDDTGRRITVELVRHWLVQRHPLRQEIWELEKLELENINHLCTVASTLLQQGKQQYALEIYKQALDINPNHFSILVPLAEGYLEVQDFDKALELYMRAYQVDPISNKEGLVLALETYGHKLVIQREFTRAKEQYGKVLEIQPNRVSAQQRFAEIAVFESRSVSTFERNDIRQYGRKLTLRALTVAAIVSAIISSTAFSVYILSTPCPAGQQKEVGFFCVADPSRISRGERTFFPNIPNSDRDLGIEAFKQKSYKNAALFFKKAVADNRNDPEILIYYNNALARQSPQGFLTLAVVVPVDIQTAEAREILRGVAQAQNQFNYSSGLNGRLLEIVIANDSNEREQAQQVAIKLAKDISILGVIGHGNSDTSEVALSEYEKAGLAMISPTSTSTLLNGNVFFRTVPSDAIIGKKLAEYAVRNLIDKIVIFYNPQSYYSGSIKDAFEENFPGQVLRRIDLSKQTFDAQKEVNRVVFEDRIEAALFFPSEVSISPALEVIRANHNLISKPTNLKKRGLKKLLAGDILYSDRTLNESRDAVEGMVLAVPWFRKSPQAKSFAQQWGGDVSWRTATSFDATQAFIKSLSTFIKSSPSDPSRPAVVQELRKVQLSPNETSGYVLQFTTNGERQSEAVLVTVKEGKFVEVLSE